jgi:peptidoglycan/xylan/chitin deacetylase (PgdA/CDA1 family)
MLSSDAIKTMASTGLFEFGAHTHHHAILSLLPRKQQIEEISRSIEAVQKITGRSCEYFAYPNGQPQDYDMDIIRVLKSHKIRGAVTGIPKPNDRTTPVMELRRYGIGYDVTLSYFQLKAHHFIAHSRRLICSAN